VAQRVVEEVAEDFLDPVEVGDDRRNTCRESQVEDHEIGFRLTRQRDGRLAVASGPYVEAVLGQVALDDAYQARLVIDDQRAQLPRRIHDQASSFAM
jgi:hypothetical protein